MAENKEELKSLLMKVKDQSEKAGLKPNIQKTKLMASGPITSWQIDRGENGNSDRLYFLGLKKSLWDLDCSHEIKRCLLLGRKVMTNLNSTLKRSHHFANKGLYGQSYGFSSSHVWMWELDHKEGWCQRTDTFKLGCWRRLLRVPWTARKSNQSILKEINPEYSVEAQMQKLKCQYFGHMMQRTNSLEKILMLGKIEGRKRSGHPSIRWLDAISDSTDMSMSKLQEIGKDREALHAAVHEVTKCQTWLSNWAVNKWNEKSLPQCLTEGTIFFSPMEEMMKFCH